MFWLRTNVRRLSLSIVGTDVLGGPRSLRLQNVHPSVIHNKATNGKDIYFFCFRTAEDVGPYKFDMILLFRQHPNTRCSANFAFCILHFLMRRQSLPRLHPRGGSAKRWRRLRKERFRSLYRRIIKSFCARTLPQSLARQLPLGRSLFVSYSRTKKHRQTHDPQFSIFNSKFSILTVHSAFERGG